MLLRVTPDVYSAASYAMGTRLRFEFADDGRD